MAKASWRQLVCVTLCWAGLAYGIVDLVAAAIFAGYATFFVHRAWIALVLRFGLEGVLVTGIGLSARAYARKRGWSINLLKL